MLVSILEGSLNWRHTEWGKFSPETLLKAMLFVYRIVSKKLQVIVQSDEKFDIFRTVFWTLTSYYNYCDCKL